MHRTIRSFSAMAVLSLLAVSQVQAQNPVEAEVLQTHEAYLEAWNEGDPKKIASYSLPPVAFYDPDDFHDYLATEDQLVEAYRVIRGGLSAEYAGSRMDSVSVHQTSDDTALVSASYSRLRPDGSLLGRVASLYVYRRTSLGWKQVASFSHDVEHHYRFVKEAP